VLAGYSDWLFEMWPTLSCWAAVDAAFLARHAGVRAAHLFEELFVHAGHRPRLRARLQQAWHRFGGGVCPLAQGLNATTAEIIIHWDICCLRQKNDYHGLP